MRDAEERNLPILTPPYAAKRNLRVPSGAKDEIVSKGSSPSNSYRPWKTWKIMKGKSESNNQIFPSFTYQNDHGEEGIGHLRKRYQIEGGKSKKVTTFHKKGNLTAETTFSMAEKPPFSGSNGSKNLLTKSQPIAGGAKS